MQGAGEGGDGEVVGFLRDGLRAIRLTFREQSQPAATS